MHTKSKSKYLLYTLCNYRNSYYIRILKQFLKALIAFSDLSAFDLCIITDDAAYPILSKIKDLSHFSNVSYVTGPRSTSLDHALLRKFDITQHPHYLEYDRILFLDCDIIVQKDIMNLFKNVKAYKNKLYVAEEGQIDGKYWKANAYLPQDIEYMKEHNIKSFNAGIFLFIPSPVMRTHFINAKIWGEQYKGDHFYDQSIFNYYFNRNKIATISPYLTDIFIMFPDEKKYYPNKILMHIAGISRYKEKAKIMKEYLERIKLVKSL